MLNIDVIATKKSKIFEPEIEPEIFGTLSGGYNHLVII